MIPLSLPAQTHTTICLSFSPSPAACTRGEHQGTRGQHRALRAHSPSYKALNKILPVPLPRKCAPPLSPPPALTPFPSSKTLLLPFPQSQPSFPEFSSPTFPPLSLPAMAFSSTPRGNVGHVSPPQRAGGGGGGGGLIASPPPRNVGHVSLTPTRRREVAPSVHLMHSRIALN